MLASVDGEAVEKILGSITVIVEGKAARHLSDNADDSAKWTCDARSRGPY
jgi:hypothetical protein